MKLSPSSAYRWIPCPGSAKLSEDVPYQPNKYAEQGTGAHALCEWALRNELEEIPASMIGTTFSFFYDHKQISLTIDEELREHCNVYVRRIRELELEMLWPKLELERRIDFKYIRQTMTYGKADAVLDDGTTLVVSDFKYGVSPARLFKTAPDPIYYSSYTRAELNPQLLIYAAGLAREYGWTHSFARLEIVQPRAFEVPDVQSVDVPISWLKDWSETQLWEAACNTEMADAPLNPGEWCHFCPAAFKCPALANKASELAEVDFATFSPPESEKDDLPQSIGARGLTKDQIARILQWMPIIDGWLREVNAAAYRMLSAGETLPGYKLVHGRNKARKWISDDPVEVVKAAGALGNQLWGEAYLISPTQAEKLGPEFKKLVQQLAVAVSGELTLAAESDRRPAIVPMTEFENLTGG